MKMEAMEFDHGRGTNAPRFESANTLVMALVRADRACNSTRLERNVLYRDTSTVGLRLGAATPLADYLIDFLDSVDKIEE